MNEPSSSESSPEHNLTDMGKFLNQVFMDCTGQMSRPLLTVRSESIF